MTWYDNSLNFIQQQAIDHPDMDRSQLKQHCSKNYPFSQRRGSAYKGFLRAMRDVFGVVGGKTGKQLNHRGQHHLF